jgi:glucosamine--fructose-6-phosphate aminotransferase (isomerizing)
MSLHSEIHQQPQVLANLLDDQSQVVREIAASVKKREPKYVYMAARGTSDNAGKYANYLWSAWNGLPVAPATPSLFTYYHQPPQLREALVVGISQSGQSPDVVSVVENGQRQGCLTIAITNSPNAPLAEAADFVIDLQAGPELAVAATKTYTAELLAVAMLSAALNTSSAQWDDLTRLASWLTQALEQDEIIGQLAQRYVFMQRCVVLGRGYNYATAFEWALKLKEMTYAHAEPYSSADFLHGPLAMIAPGFPVLSVAPSGALFDVLIDLIKQLRQAYGADLVVISDDPEALALAHTPIALPGGIPEWISPLVSIIPAQLFAYHLARARGYDTEQPRNIHKVTETR